MSPWNVSHVKSWSTHSLDANLCQGVPTRQLDRDRVKALVFGSEVSDRRALYRFPTGSALGKP
jgi:hypothetical protein